MPGIFISYRRDDTSGHAGRLFDRLAQRFGPDSVFMDVTDIAPGEDFTRVIEDSVGKAELLLALIGPQWLSASDGAGSHRLDDPADFVRREIAAGLHHATVVVPVLVRGARMPREDQLPEELRPLARRQAVELSDNRWESDLAEFERALDKRFGNTDRNRRGNKESRAVRQEILADRRGCDCGRCGDRRCLEHIPEQESRPDRSLRAAERRRAESAS